MEAETGNLAQATTYLKKAASLRSDHAFLNNVVTPKVMEKKNELLRTKQEKEESHG